MDKNGRLIWNAPAGNWLLLRFGQSSNLKTTRPCPAKAVGLEADRMETVGIETHYKAFLKQVYEEAGTYAGRSLTYAHIDSWEAGPQNWSASFPDEFKKRRGYSLYPWLPVMTGRVIENRELSERFLWDVRRTAHEMIMDNFVKRFKSLLKQHSIKLSIEAYGGKNTDDFTYAGIADMPISEFWATGHGRFPELPPIEHFTRSSKAMASSAHVYGLPIVGAEAFTGQRFRQDHPYHLKWMGDWAFCTGVNRFIFHLAAHQAYENMIPGLTHRMHGEHFDRFNTWFEYSTPWMDYLARCQYLLQQGRFIADVCVWIGEGAPLLVGQFDYELPEGYDFDYCPTEQLLKMKVKDGMLTLPSGMCYRYLVLPDVNRITLPSLTKINELVNAGARVVAPKRPVGSPSLQGYPHNDAEVKRIAKTLWDEGKVIQSGNMAELFRKDGLEPDFEGAGLRYHHKRINDADVYFLSHSKETPTEIECSFRISDRVPELWNPETGEIHRLPDFTKKGGRITCSIPFGPMQSWFVVFRATQDTSVPAFVDEKYQTLQQVDGDWKVHFDPQWGGPEQPVIFDGLTDWKNHPNKGIRYYSGTATYTKTVKLDRKTVDQKSSVYVNLGKVEVIARVRVNGIDCGITWKPPYRVDISEAVQSGENELEIDVVNLLVNRMISDEQLPLDSKWKDQFTLLEWPDWFQQENPSPTGRYTFTSARHYQKKDALKSSGLLGPVELQIGN